MGIFSRKNKTDFASEKRLPELPKLPALPRPDNEDDFKSPAPKLPKFPDSYFGEKFSQNNIKEAVTGKKEDEVFADEFDSEDEFQTMHEPQIKEISDDFSRYNKKIVKETVEREEREEFFRGKKTEKSPVFIRIDRFEEGRDSLEKIKKQISEIEKILGNIKGVKEAERKELETWEREIQAAKQQVEKINNGLFSRIE